MKPILVYLLLINAAAMILMLVDKYKAKRNLWRIPEATLLLIAFLGGSFGALIGMRVTHHKTKHVKFALGLPLLLALHIMIGIFIYQFL